jgi:hypothetical protein
LNSARPDPRHEVKASVDEELAVLEGQEAVGLVPPMILRPQTPVNTWKHRLIVVVDGGEHAAFHSYLIFHDGQ